jgi:hypothetical protein
MATKKLKRKKKVVAKKKATPVKKSAPKKKAAKKAAPKKIAVAKTKAANSKKLASLKKTASPGKSASPKKAARPAKQLRGRASDTRVEDAGRKGFGPDSGGQSGDLQGLSRAESADSESVEELLEEGQAFEAEAISGVENALDPDESEVTTKEVPEDDVPEEDRDQQ